MPPLCKSVVEEAALAWLETLGYAAVAAQTRNESINPRVSKKEKTLIDPAAKLLDRSRSDFMLAAACREAEALLLDQKHFSLSAEKFKRFMARLDKSPSDNVKLKKLLESKAPWEP